MRPGRPYKRELVVTAEQKARLKEIVARQKSSQSVARRARMILLCDQGLTLTEVGRRLEVTPQSVAHWRNRFIDLGVDGLSDAPRVGRPRQIDDAQVEEVIRETLESTPRGQTHWSQRKMAEKVDISRESIGRICLNRGGSRSIFPLRPRTSYAVLRCASNNSITHVVRYTKQGGGVNLALIEFSRRCSVPEGIASVDMFLVLSCWYSDSVRLAESRGGQEPRTKNQEPRTKTMLGMPSSRGK